MNKISIIAGSITLLITGCEGSTADAGLIDYNTLNKIEAELTAEIGESGEYLPGQLMDLVLSSDGTMLVSDLGKTTIEQFNAEGVHVATIAREGRGPGELPSFCRLTDAGNDTVIVQHSSGSAQVDLFARGADGIYRYSESIIPERPAIQRLDLIGSRSETEYYAVTGLRDVAHIALDQPDYRQSPVAVVDGSLEVIRDSLHMLKTANHLFGAPDQYSSGITMNGLTYLGMPPYRYQDRFIPMEDGRYLVARADSAALFIYNSSHEPIRKIPLNIKARPVQSTDLDYALEGKSSKTRRELEAHVDEVKPPFLNVWVSEDRIWLHTDNTKEGKQMVVLTMEGKPLGKFMLPAVDEIQYCKNERIYTIHKDPGTGHTIRIYSVTL